MNPDLSNDLESPRLTRAFKKTFLSLKHRNFRLYFSGQLISNTGNWLTNIAITLLVLKVTKSDLAVGLLAVFQYGPILFFSAYAGAVADRANKRNLLYITQSLEMAESIGLAVLAFMPRPPIDGLFILALAGGLFLAFDNPLRRSFVSEMVPQEDIPNAVVLYSTILNVSRIFGPALAGVLIASLGYGWCFAIDAISYIAVLLSLFKMRPNELYRHKIKAKVKGEVKAGLRYVTQVPLLWISFAMLAVIGTLSYNFNITLPIFTTQSLHTSSVMYTIIYSTYSFGAVIASLLLAHRSHVKMMHVILGALTLGITMLLLAAVPNSTFALPAVILLGMSSILYTTSTTTIAQVESVANMRGRVLALQTVLLAGPTAIGGPILGYMASQLGGRSPIIFGGIVSLIVAIIGFILSKRFAPELLQKNKEQINN